ncbi:RNA-directed DNA polymerase, eukaryota, reverse transcriptase zinc-binding domain protein [Tanacetum coccineum]
MKAVQSSSHVLIVPSFSSSSHVFASPVSDRGNIIRNGDCGTGSQSDNTVHHPLDRNFKEYQGSDEIMENLKFGSKWHEWIAGCMSNSRASILVNGSPTTEFEIFKGLRQGYPLSPFLFILVMEGLHAITCKVVNIGMFKGVSIREGVSFSDENIFNMATVLGCGVAKLPMTYLAWLLSIGGRFSLIKSVVCNLLTYYLSLYKMPTYVQKKLESMRNKFFIRGYLGDKKVTWVKWNACLASKALGGLVIRGIHGQDGASIGFSIASACKFTDEHILPCGLSCTRWNRGVPIKVNVFMWRLNLDKLLSMVNMECKGIDIDSLLCLVCGDHLLQNTRKFPPQASKAAGEPSGPLDVDNDPDIHDCHWVVSHVTPPSWKHHLKEISLDKLCDIHDKAYIRLVVLNNVMNRRTRKLMSTLLKARAACDPIREKEKEKDKVYAELKAKCNDALQDLDKNPLVLDLCAEVETLQEDKLHGEYSRQVLEEKKWVKYDLTLAILRFKVEGLEIDRERLKKSETQVLHDIDGLKQDRAVVMAKVVPHVSMELARSDEMGRKQAFEQETQDLDVEIKQMKAFKASYGVTILQELRRNHTNEEIRSIMDEEEIDNLTIEQYLTLTRGNQAPGVVKPKIGGNVNLEIKSHFMRELREDTFSWNKNDDAHEHVERGPIPGMTPAQALTAIQTMVDHSQKWHNGSSSMNIDSSSSFEGIDAIVSKLDSLGRDMKKLKENVQAIQVGCQTCGGAHLNKECPLNKETKKETAKRHAEQHEWLRKFYQNIKTNQENHEKIIERLETKVKTLKNEIEGRTNRECKAIFTKDGSHLYTPFYYSPEEIENFSANSGFSYDEKQETKESGDNEGIATIDITPNIEHACQEEKQDVRYYVDTYE